MASAPESLVNFRGSMIRAMKERGHDVLTCAPEDTDDFPSRQALEEMGAAFQSVPLRRAGLNPFRDLDTIRALESLIRRVRPDRVLAYTAKPVIYGGIASARVGNVPFFAMITGVGYAFTQGAGLRRRILGRAVRLLYKRGLRSARCVFFQNPDDQRLFHALGLLPDAIKVRRLQGSGVDLEKFPRQPMPVEPIFLMLSRLVADKGVREYIEAARHVRHQVPGARCLLAGSTDSNPSAIRLEEIHRFHDEGIIEYLGALEDVRPTLASCRYYVLPSYREGMPRSVLEALATGRPVITTDAPGCRETVVQGLNGLLVAPRDAQALTSAMLEMIEAPSDTVESMGAASRRMAEERFDDRKVNAEILEAMDL